MATTPQIREWAERYHRDGRGRGVAFAMLARWGWHRGAADLIEEARQEAIARVLRAYEPARFNDYTHFANTVTRTAVNWLRDQRRTAGGTALFDEDLPAPPIDTRPALVGRALAALPPDDRELVTAAVIDGLSLDELAERFLAPDTGSANARRLRVRRQLRAALGRLRDAYARLDTD